MFHIKVFKFTKDMHAIFYYKTAKNETHVQYSLHYDKQCHILYIYLHYFKRYDNKANPATADEEILMEVEVT